MINARIIVYCLLAILCTSGLYAQQTSKFSLSEALDYAMEHNYSLQNDQTDIKIAKKKVWETTAQGLPQITGKGSYNNFLELATMLIPAEFMGGEAGTFAEVQFGTKHNLSADLTLTQLIFSGSYLVGLQASRAYQSLSETQLIKRKIEIRETVTQAYHTIVALEDNQALLKEIHSSLEKMHFEAKETYKSGFIEDTDVEQLELLKTEVAASLDDINTRILIAYNYLKFQMGMESNHMLQLTHRLADFEAEITSNQLGENPFEYSHNIDYLMLKNQEKLAFLNLKLARAQYLPTLAGFFNVQKIAQRNTFNFFDRDQPWFNTSLIGIELNIPLFASGGRRAKVQQAQLEIEKIKVLDKQIQAGLQLEISSARADFSNAFKILSHKKRSKTIAQRIYTKTQLKYREGVSSSMDLLNAHNQYLQAETAYTQAALSLLNAHTHLNKLLTRN